MFEPGRARSFGKKQVTPKNASQRRYMEEIEKHDMMFGIGPGGTERRTSRWPMAGQRVAHPSR